MPSRPIDASGSERSPASKEESASSKDEACALVAPGCPELRPAPMQAKRETTAASWSEAAARRVGAKRPPADASTDASVIASAVRSRSTLRT